jgi:hypothetical protein
MSVHIYKSTSLDLNKLVASLTKYYEEEHFEVQHTTDQEQGRSLVQIKKAGALRTIAGLGKALGIHIQQAEDGLQVKVAIEDWAWKLSAQGLESLLLPILSLPVFLGSIDEVHFAHKVLDEVDRLVHEQDPSVEIERNHAVTIQ